MIRRLSVPTTLALVVELSPVPRTLARTDPGGSYSVCPRVVATVTALEPQGLVTIRTITGATYEVVQRTPWRVGDWVEYKHVATRVCRGKGSTVGTCLARRTGDERARCRHRTQQDAASQRRCRAGRRQAQPMPMVYDEGGSSQRARPA